ncbi:hypothetical protein RHMOL_Rhmol07G0106600 [Rhododendron molle]|uniref:Uncharacterized protein n=1 Tax=Rhododendron molle TaxID=49168 RepID=A0ACC0N199_RHOML|nr:hypothetical protein RHMOL_Rhmol07G0106600 [Rhododendron molle]
MEEALVLIPPKFTLFAKRERHAVNFSCSYLRNFFLVSFNFTQEAALVVMPQPKVYLIW